MSKDMGASTIESDKYNEWAVQRAVDVLTQAEEIKQDAKMMKLVSKEIGKRQEALDKIKPSSAEVMYGKKEEKE